MQIKTILLASCTLLCIQCINTEFKRFEGTLEYVPSSTLLISKKCVKFTRVLRYI